MNVHLTSLGCARTLVDSEVALGSLKKDGYTIVRGIDQADIAIVNTCGFIEDAKMESIEAILELCELKKQGKIKAVVVLGCLAQRHGGELQKELDEVDAIVGTNNFGDLSRVLEPLKKKNGKVFEVTAKPYYLLDENSPRFSLTPEHYAYIKISEGCINACSYCMIPKMKGTHRSRTVESIVSEIKKITYEREISEINLIGQDTAAFGFDRSRTFELPRLLNEVAALGKAEWVRLLYAHPGHVTNEMIDAIAQNPSICKYVDFPIEHSHDDMLKRMNRGVDRQKMEWGIETLRKKIPGVVIRTTVIVGFPGETEAEFKDLMKFLKEVRFERLGTFKFSNEEGSRASSMPDHISEEVKEARYHAVMAQQMEISKELNKPYLGKTIKVLIDEAIPNKKNAYLARTEGDAPDVDNQVTVTSDTKLKPGQFVNMRVEEALEYDLVGRAV